MDTLKSVKTATFSDISTPMPFALEAQIQAMKTEHEAFHALMALIPNNIKDEVITLWVRGTDASADEAFYRRAQRAELTESQYRDAQDIAHKAWQEMVLGK